MFHARAAEVMLFWLLLGCPAGTPVRMQSAEEETWRQYLRNFLSEAYIAAHFELAGIYRSAEGGQATVFHTIRYGEEIAHTRTSLPLDGKPVSGVMRIQGGNQVQSYFGPVREYELKVPRDRALTIIRSNGCVFQVDPDGAPAQAEQNQVIRLFVGDYFEIGGKYSPDYIPEGFYWVGGQPPAEKEGTECMVDAETGAFNVKRVGPH